jgi:hypothetical protein
MLGNQSVILQTAMQTGVTVAVKEYLKLFRGHEAENSIRTNADKLLPISSLSRFARNSSRAESAAY